MQGLLRRGSRKPTNLEHGLQVAALAVLHDDVRVLGVLVHIVEPGNTAALLYRKYAQSIGEESMRYCTTW